MGEVVRLRFEWTSQSSITFHAAHNRSPITATTHEVRGWVEVEMDGEQFLLNPLPVGYIECDIDSLRSSNRLDDFEMRRQVDAKHFPTLRYEFREAIPVEGAFIVNGDLTFHGVSREVTETCTVTLIDNTIQVAAEHAFDVRDFGVEPPRILRRSVEPFVTITLNLHGECGTHPLAEEHYDWRPMT